MQSRGGRITSGLATSVLLFLASCSDSTLVYVGWPEVEGAVGLLVVVPERGAPRLEARLELLGPDPDPRRLGLAESEELYLLPLSERRLAEEDPRLHLRAPERLALVPLPASCERGALMENARALPLSRAVSDPRRPLESAWVPTSLPGALSAIGLSIPRDEAAGCSAGARLRQRPFLSTPLAPPGPVSVNGELLDPAEPWTSFCQFSVAGVAWLDELRIGVLTPCGVLYRHQEGSEFPGGPPGRIELPQPGPPPNGTAWYARSLAVFATTSTSGEDRLLVTYNALDALGEARAGALVLYHVEPSGRASSRALLSRAHAFGLVEVAPDGSFLTGGEDGTVFVGRAERGVDFELRLGPNRAGSPDFIEAGADADGTVFVFSTVGAEVFAVWPDAEGGARLIELTPSYKLSDVRGFALRETPGGPAEVWLGTYSDGVLRRPLNGAWENVPVAGPPGLESCSAPVAACGERGVEDFIAGLVVLDHRRILVGPAACSGAVVLDPLTGCTEAVASSFEPVARVERRSRYHHVVRSAGGRVAVTSRQDHLLVLEEVPE